MKLDSYEFGALKFRSTDHNSKPEKMPVILKRNSLRRAMTLLVAFFGCHRLLPSVADELMKQRHWRRPIAIAPAESWLFVANRDSGSLSVINSTNRKVVRELKIGERLSDLKTAYAGRFLLALDESKHQLIVLARSRSELRVVQELAIAKYPVTLDVAPDNSYCSIASLWSRQVSVIDLSPLNSVNTSDDSPHSSLSVTHVVSLPFTPGVQKILSDKRRLVVTDAFAGRLGLLELTTGRLISLRDIPGHNIRGIHEDQQRGELLITHQRARPKVSTLSENIQWGGVISNLIRVVPMREFDETNSSDEAVSPIHPKPLGGIIYPLGRSEDGAGDPYDIKLTPKGQLLVSFSGVSQVAIGSHPGEQLARITVGQRPTAITTDGDQRFAFVANTLEDSISIIDLQERTKVEDISLGSKPETTLAQRGEQLFFDARVSLNGWFSCHSCHSNGHTHGLLSETFGDGTLGAPKRTPSLLGVGSTPPWAWTGNAQTLHDQIVKTIRTTMRGSPLVKHQEANAHAIEAYLRTLNSPPGLDIAQNSVNVAAAERGQKIFEQQKCVVCHTPPTYTSSQTVDVGLQDELGHRRFNPPSLRGVSQREPYFHDNRATNLRDVLTRFRHGQTTELSPAEHEDLLAFLRTL